MHDAGSPAIRILFVSHEATRTGAPLILLRLMQWIRQQRPTWQMDILSLKDGELLQEFTSLADQHYQMSRLEQRPAPSLLQRAVAKMGRLAGAEQTDARQRLLEQLASNSYQLIYANTILSLPVAAAIRNQAPQTKLLLHVHELALLTEYVLPDFRQYAAIPDLYIAASNLVAGFLRNDWELPLEKLHTVFEFAERPLPSPLANQPKHTFVAGASGTVHWRKGTDLFLQTALCFKNKYPGLPVEFHWVGFANRYEKALLEHDIRHAGLNNVVYWGEMKDPAPAYGDFDLLLLTSREDPFPLVAIELAMMGKPIIGFEGVSGTAEFVQKGAGKLVPYADAVAMADAVAAYYHDRQALQRDGELAQKIFETFTPENSCRTICEIVENQMAPVRSA